MLDSDGRTFLSGRPRVSRSAPVRSVIAPISPLGCGTRPAFQSRSDAGWSAVVYALPVSEGSDLLVKDLDQGMVLQSGRDGRSHRQRDVAGDRIESSPSSSPYGLRCT